MAWAVSALLRSTRGTRSTRINETGSALLLVPATFLIVLMLALLALNSALSFLATQELERRASAAANDAASGLARNGYFVSGGYVIDANGARTLGANSANSRGNDSYHPKDGIVVEQISATTVRATAYGSGASLTSKLLPWTSPELEVTVEAEAKDQ
jgi:hypothetical protein